MLIDIPIDFELYYDQQYSLDRLTAAEYVLDPRFEIIGCGITTPDGVDHWISGDANHVRSELLRLVPDWSAVRVIAHNARLEAAVLEWRLQIKPAMYLCTMVGARPHVVPYTRSMSLDAVSRYFKVGVKGDAATKAKGLHRSDFSAAQLAAYGEYCIGDSHLTWGIAQNLIRILPWEEQEILDLTIKKFVRPKLMLSQRALVARLQDIELKKEQLIGILERDFKCGIAEIRSRPKFAKLLSDHGVEPPKKLNKKGAATYAFAKDDLAFKELLAHSDVRIRQLVQAKLALSSTLEEGRVKRLITLCDLKGGELPVPLVYYGAHPGRLSGDDEINLQNLPRVEFDESGGLRKGHLRYAVQAPPGYSVVAADFSNIEARIVATLAGQVDLRDGFAAGRDIYAEFAAKVYQRPINKRDNPQERFVGKTCILGLGYGMGGAKFALRIANEGIYLQPKAAIEIVHLYRNTYSKIPQLWGALEHAMRTHMLTKGGLWPSPWAGITFAHERIILPNGMPIIYPNLKADGRGLTFDSRFAKGVDRNIWGGMTLENIAQALARIIASRAELTLAKAGLPTALQVHDELVWVVPTAIVERVKAVVAAVMTRRVDFMPELPIAVEVKHGPTYGDAK
jgi:DNA polymerase I-like protein with 3'-5' exonuclease and polymerase domains